MKNFKVGDYVYLMHLQEVVRIKSDFIAKISNDPTNDVRKATDNEIREYKMRRGNY